MAFIKTLLTNRGRCSIIQYPVGSSERPDCDLVGYPLLHRDVGNDAGRNMGAALAQGVPVKRVKVMVFALTGLLTGLASVMQFAHRTSVDPLRGEGWELIAVAATVIGGVQLTGGLGTILGACMGILLLQTLEQGLVLMSVPVQIFRAVAGLILMLSVIGNTYLSRQG